MSLFGNIPGMNMGNMNGGMIPIPMGMMGQPNPNAQGGAKK